MKWSDPTKNEYLFQWQYVSLYGRPIRCDSALWTGIGAFRSSHGCPPKHSEMRHGWIRTFYSVDFACDVQSPDSMKSITVQDDKWLKKKFCGADQKGLKNVIGWDGKWSDEHVAWIERWLMGSGNAVQKNWHRSVSSQDWFVWTLVSNHPLWLILSQINMQHIPPDMARYHPNHLESSLNPSELTCDCRDLITPNYFWTMSKINIHQTEKQLIKLDWTDKQLIKLDGWWTFPWINGRSIWYDSATCNTIFRVRYLLSTISKSFFESLSRCSQFHKAWSCSKVTSDSSLGINQLCHAPSRCCDFLFITRDFGPSLANYRKGQNIIVHSE
jgi:hypothetical protein